MILGAMLLMLTMNSCREEADRLVSYDHNDDLVFGAAEKSFAAQFKVFWNGMNQNYGLWDYEEEQGVDWNAVYDQFLPRFEELDERDQATNPVSDDEYQKLIEELVVPLHDGHFYASFKNLHTGNYVTGSPGFLHVKDRDDYENALGFVPMLDAYIESGMVTEHRYATTSKKQLADNFRRTKYKTTGMGYVTDRIATLKKKEQDGTITATEQEELSALSALAEEWNAGMVSIKTYDQLVALYDHVAATYGLMNIPGLYVVDSTFDDIGITMQYALFNDNIPYLAFSGFKISAYIDPAFLAKYLSGLVKGSSMYYLAENMSETWLAWFNKVQELKANGTLKGVIIDIRSNGGGFMNDYQYVLGALMEPGTDIQIGYQRFKRGMGRYDYSPLMPDIRNSVDLSTKIPVTASQLGITEPIAVMTNCLSVSMSEMTTMGAKILDNVCVVGKRTFGGLCGLTENSAYSFNYSGHIGVENVTPVYCYTPAVVTIQLDKKTILESIGIMPDIEVAFDLNQFKATRVDTQLDRAIQFIQTGN